MNNKEIIMLRNPPTGNVCISGVIYAMQDTGTSDQVLKSYINFEIKCHTFGESIDLVILEAENENKETQK